MAEVKRVFLGWDAPLVTKVRDYLLEGINASKGFAPDLEGTLIVVPTRQAGRRLRESLALWCSEHDTAMLSAEVVSPNHLFSVRSEQSGIAGDVLALSVWVQVLTHADLDGLSALFPSGADDRNFQWALNTGEILQRLRDELCDGAMTIGSVVARDASKLEELDRWQDLAALEKLYIEEMGKLGMKDLCVAKIATARESSLDEGITKVVVAGVPDPSLLAVAALRRVVASGVDVEILIHATPELEEEFDEWGRPRSDYWQGIDIDLPDWKDTVFLEAKPSDQAVRVIKEISRFEEEYEPGQLAIGVPDTAVIPCLEKALAAEGLPAFDPSDKLSSEHPIGRLSACILELLRECSSTAVADLLRHPDYLSYLKDVHSLKSQKVLSQLDDFYNCYLPNNLRSMLSKYKDNPAGSISHRHDFTDLGKALEEVKMTTELFLKGNFEESWRTFYQRIYSKRILEPGAWRDTEFENAAQAVDDALRDFRELDEAGAEYDILQSASFFVKRLNSSLYHRERRDEKIDLEGWLELPWNDRPYLIVTGMNDDCVPGGSLSDVFLPDSLRRALDLRDDASRLARDAYLMQSMIKARASSGGRTCFIVGKVAIAGDPLRPSRLLFRCADSELPIRVEKLLAETATSLTRAYPQVVFQLHPGKAEQKSDSRGAKFISVTSVKDYLACPTRYYMKTLLGMEAIDYSKTSLDARDFGSLAHDVLQKMGEDKKLWSMQDAEKLGGILAEEAAKSFCRIYGKLMSPYVIVSLAAVQERLKAVAREQVIIASEGWEIVDVETGHGENGAERNRWRLKRSGYTISGIIDRIDKHKKTGKIRIIDYKTFDDTENKKHPESEHLVKRSDADPTYNLLDLQKPDSKGDVKHNERRWLDLQLPLYAMIYDQETKYNENVELAYFVLPKSVSHTGLRLWGKFDHQRMESAVTCLDGVLEALNHEVFWPPAEKVKYDDFEDMFRFEDSVREV